MNHFSTEYILIIGCSFIIVSYLFSILSRFIKVPAVLLLMASGIVLRWFSIRQQWGIAISGQIIEFLGTVGLIMIVLEAGLDLQVERNKTKIIRNSFFAALIIFLLCVGGIASVLRFWLGDDTLRCIVYAIPLSIMSSSIVIPSLQHLSESKKEFLVYEASFSDMLGILVFNFFIGKEILSAYTVVHFFFIIILAVLFSLFFSLLLFVIITKTKMNIKFFLVFALLIILYEGGKLMELPSLLIILIFGMLMRNWNHLYNYAVFKKYFSGDEVQNTSRFLHSITAESSFLIRTFFFILFGYSINITQILQPAIAIIGSAIVAILFLMRLLYLRFFLKESVYPEVFFIPRGLITILLFYKIPAALQLKEFDDGILFFIILLTSIVMMLGMFFYKKEPDSVAEEVSII